MEGLIDKILRDHTPDEIICGSPLDITKVSKAKQERIMVILVHCCVNGPVSPKKETTYPVIGETSLDNEYGTHVTNGTLRATCRLVAEHLTRVSFRGGSRVEIHGSFWPLYL